MDNHKEFPFTHICRSDIPFNLFYYGKGRVVLQREITSKKKNTNEINIRVIQEVATDIGALVRYTSDIRSKTAKIKTLTKKIS